MPPFYIEYYCPRQNANTWQRWGAGLFNRTGKAFLDLGMAEQAADSLIWKYHSARVVDGAGSVYYQI